MRAALATLSAVVLSACFSEASHDHDAEEQTANVSERKTLSEPGVERIRQHQGPANVAESQRKSFRLDHTITLARLSEIAYAPPAEIRSALAELGLDASGDHFRYWESSCTDTQAFYLTTASLSAPPVAIANPYNRAARDFAVLVFRGTEPNAQDIGTDLRVWRTDEIAIGSAHGGFLRALESVWKAHPECGVREGIGTFLREHHRFDGRPSTPVRLGAELYFTGHSLGGALATLALAKTATEECEKTGSTSEQPCFHVNTPVSALYSFGSPRPFDATFANTLARWMQDRTPIYRVVHGADLVARVPAAFAWRHPGFDGSEGDLAVAVLRDPFAIEIAPRDQPRNASAEDHGIGRYIEALAATRR